MAMFAYQVRGRGRRPLAGVTKPVRGKLAAVIKSDGDEIPTCVYNELTAARIGALIGFPAAQGVPAQGVDAMEYASLLAATPGGRLPPITRLRAKAVAGRYPSECAATLVFDIFIGNWDRAGNIKAAIASPAYFFCAFDHSHSLLALDDTPDESIERLASHDPGMTTHIFQGEVARGDVDAWVRRVKALTSDAIERACCPGGQVNSVSTRLQKSLAKALIARQAFIENIIDAMLERDEVSN